MKRSVAALALVLLPLLAGLLAACAAWSYQHAAPGPAPAAAEPPTTAASAQFRALNADAQVGRLRGEAVTTKETLAEAGHYNCCIRPACNLCLLRDGRCTCREVIQTMGPGCGECLQGWIAGKGAVDGVDVRQILEDKLKEVKDKPAAPPPGKR